MNAIPRPKKKTYQYEDDWTKLASHITDKKMVKFDKDEYLKDLENYEDYLENLIEKIESK